MLLAINEDTLYDHLYDVFAVKVPESRKLGIEQESDTVDVTIEPYEQKKHAKSYQFTVKQSIPSLNSKGSTTGYVLWQVTPRFAKWLLFHPGASFLRDGGSMRVNDNTEVGFAPVFGSQRCVELGSGIAGVLPLVLANFCSHVIATDQPSLVPRLKHNLLENIKEVRAPVSTCTLHSSGAFEISTLEPLSKKSKPTTQLDCVAFDWESSQECLKICEPLLGQPIDYIFALDVVYNEYLVPYLVETCRLLCTPNRTKVVIVVQRRTEEVMETFLTELTERFKVYAVDQNSLDADLGVGFCCYIAELPVSG